MQGSKFYFGELSKFFAEMILFCYTLVNTILCVGCEKVFLGRCHPVWPRPRSKLVLDVH